MLEKLNQFHGSGQFYKHLAGTIIYTEGVKYWASEVGGYWFLDIIATEFYNIEDDFVFIEMTVKDTEAEIMVSDGNNNVYKTKTVGFTDCPSGAHKFYLEINASGSKTLLLPSEH